MFALVTAVLLGAALGLRHAFEPDHLAAVSSLIADRPGKARGFWLGAAWGLGHTLSLLAVGGALCLFETRLSTRVEDLFELLVAAMLVFLGARALARARTHVHAHVDPVKQAKRSLAVGMTHGLAGSGALTALAVAAMPTNAARIGYMLVFGLGSAVGMGCMTAFAGRTVHALRGHARVERGLLAAVGAFSLLFGVAWGVPHAARLWRGEPPAATART